MKIKKTIAVLLAAATAAVMGASLVACNDGSTVVDPGKNPGSSGGGMKTTIIEAEYINLDDVAGGGISSNQSGLEMIYGSGEQADINKGWSNGYYVGYTYTAECVMEFVFESDKDTTGTIVIRLGSELGNITVRPQDVKLEFNGAAVNYGSWYIQGTENDMANAQFKDYTVSSNAQIKKGTNKLVLSVQENRLTGNGTGGPLIDCVKITSDANITYDAKTDNPSHKGEI